ncbi:MAG TPA: glycosyltransferase family 39 protein [Candidatus Acidoferrales bacterium]|nr:glycosyltransferase family 39 protein [Candidatus Acidoferrales bacterium]
MALAAFVLFFNLAGARTLTFHEGLVAVVAREMVASGDWIVPRFGGVPRLEKPPLAAWLVAGLSRVTGGVDEWTARLPAALSGLLLVCLIGSWGIRWYGRRAGLLAAVVQSTTVYTITQARLGEVDMTLCLLTTAALFLVATEHADEPKPMGHLRWIAFYLFVGISWLGKFIAGPVLVLVPAAIYLLVRDGARGLVRLLNPIGAMCFSALVAFWPALVAREIPQAWATWHDEIVGRSLGAMGREPPWYYFYAILWLMLPWTPATIAALPQSWRRGWKEGETRERFLWTWFLGQLALLSLSAFKHQHYIIPALPALSLMTGRWLDGALASGARLNSRGLSRRAAVAGMIVLAGIGSGAIFIAGRRWPELILPLGLGIGMGALGGCVAIGLLYLGRIRAAALAALLVFIACYLGAVGWLLPRRDPRLPAVEFARKADARVPAGRPVVLYAMGPSPLAFYLKRGFVREESVAGLRERLGREGTIYVIARTAALGEIEKFARIRRIEETRNPTESFLRKNPPLSLVEVAQGPVAVSDQVSAAANAASARDRGGPAAGSAGRVVEKLRSD